MNAIAGSLQSVRPEALPPTESAARFHCQRVYLQVMAWKHLESTSTVKGGKRGVEAREKKTDTNYD